MTPTNPIPEGMKAYGPEHPDYPNAPSDWNGIEVHYRNGATGAWLVLTWEHEERGSDIIAYPPTPPVGDSAAIDYGEPVAGSIHEPAEWFASDCASEGEVSTTPLVEPETLDRLTQGDSAAERARECLAAEWKKAEVGRADFGEHPDDCGCMLCRADAYVDAGEHLAVAKGGGALETDGYAAAFYELADLMGIPARPNSPAEVWRDEMLPRLQAALAERPARPMPDRGLFQAAANIVYRIEAAGRLPYEADNFERWKADARDLAPRLRLALLSQDRGEGDLSIDYEVWQKDAFGEGDGMVAGSTSLSEARHYAAVYSQDAPAWVVQVTRRPIDATLPSPASGEGEAIREALEARDRKVGECPDANLDPDKPCPRCQALRDEGCRLTILADAAFVHAARAALDSQQEKG